MTSISPFDSWTLGTALIIEIMVEYKLQWWSTLLPLNISFQTFGHLLPCKNTLLLWLQCPCKYLNILELDTTLNIEWEHLGHIHCTCPQSSSQGVGQGNNFHPFYSVEETLETHLTYLGYFQNRYWVWGLDIQIDNYH